MLTTLRTYRVISAAVAAMLLAGVAMPLARYACVMTGLSVTMPSMPRVSMCPNDHEQHSQRRRGCRGPTAHLCPPDGLCPHGEKCRNATHAAAADGCCDHENVRAEQAPKVGSQQPAANVVLPLLAVLTDIEAPPPLHSSFAERVISRSAGGGVSAHVLYGSFLL